MSVWIKVGLLFFLYEWLIQPVPVIIMKACIVGDIDYLIYPNLGMIPLVCLLIEYFVLIL